MFLFDFLCLAFSSHSVGSLETYQLITDPEEILGQMTDNIGTVWVTALDQYADSLEVHDRRRIRATPSLEALLSEIGELQAQYARKTWARIFERLIPAMQWLSGFNHCIQTFTQAAPKAFVLLWGSLSFILEVSTSE